MGFRFEQHSDMCGCERCAQQWDTENPSPVWDKISDPGYRDDGTHLSEEPLPDEADYDDYADHADYEED